MPKPIVTIVGRPNVGKSTLFNRIARERIAIVEGQPGVTRDRLYAEVEWLNKRFLLVDTGGIDTGEDDITKQVRVQAEIAISQADVILFVVDGRVGLTSADEEVGKLLRKTAKKVVLCVNKVENPSEGWVHAAEFYQLGLGDPVSVSAEHALNIGDLLDEVVTLFPVDMDLDDDDSLKVAIVGRPNVGKSSFVNKVLGEDRVIVSEVAGTTRDAIDTPFLRGDRTFLLIDTAGLRRKSRIDQPLERYSVLRTLRAIERSDVTMMMIDAEEGLTEQDKKIVGFAHDNGKGILLAVNKWDLVAKETNTMRDFERDIRSELQFVAYAPIVFISALTGRRLGEALDLIAYVAEQRSLRIPTGRLNELVQDAVAMNQPPSDKGVPLKIFYATQAQVNPPVFLIHVNHRKLMHYSYRRYLENRLRREYGFVGTPLILSIKERG